MFELHYDFSGLPRTFYGKSGVAGTFPSALTLISHGLERAHASFIARASGLDALANPHFLLCQFFVEQVIGSLFGLQLLFPVAQESLVVAV